MPKFTVFWLAVYFGGMVASFINPLFGVLAYLFEYYLRPRLHWWGNELPDWRWNLAIGVVALVTFLMYRAHLRRLPSLKNAALPWLIGMLLVMAVVTTYSVDPEISWNETIAFGKIIIIYALIIGNVRSESTFDAVVAMHIAGAGWWGWEAYMDPHRISGRLMNVGSSDTLNDNLAAAHLLTVVPFVCVYALTAKQKLLRLLSVAAAPFIVNTFILCNSRGATLGLLASFVTGLTLARPKHRLRVTAVAVAVGVMFYVLADPQFIDRQQTTINDEAAGAERKELWTAAAQLLADNPLGVGGGGFEFLSPIYAPEAVERAYGQPKAVHNTYLLVVTEWGIQGFIMFVGFLTMTFLQLRRARLRASADSSLYYRAAAVQLALVGTLTAGFFSSRFLGESIYWMCGLAFALYRVQEAELQIAVDDENGVADADAAGYRPAEATS